MERKEEIKVSVIVPVYKTERTVGRCLESLCRQTLQEIEIIVIDDGTPDNACDIVEQYITRDKRIKLYHQKNTGLGAARNYAITLARGEFIACVDSDDFVDPGMCEMMYRAARNENAEICICQEENYFFDKEQEFKHITGTNYPKDCPSVSNEKVLEWFLNFRYLALNSVCFKIIKRELYLRNDIHFPEKYRHAEDIPTSAALYLTAQRIAIVPKGLYCYVREKGSLTYTYTLKKARDNYLDIIDVCNYAERFGYKGELSNFILGMTFTTLKHMYWSKEKNKELEKQIKQELKELRKERNLKPRFTGKDIPFMHKVKILCAYMYCTKLMCYLLRALMIFPFFRYMV